MATVGIIDIKMRTTTDEFIGGIAKAGAALRQFANQAATFATVLGAGAFGGAVGLAAYKLRGLTMEAMESVSEMGRAADRLGVTTEAFSGIAFGAKKSGVEVGEFTRMLEKMRARLAEVATTGKGQAASAIATLGVDAEALAKGDAVSSLKAIADAMAKIPSPAERAQVAFKLFEEEGGKLLRFLGDGSAGIDALSARAAELGVTFSQLEFGQVEAANQAWLDFGEALEGVGVRVAVSVSPYLRALSETFADLAKQGGGIGDIVASAFEGAASVVGVFADALYSVRAVTLAVKSWFLELAVVFSKVGAAAQLVFDKMAGRDVQVNLSANLAVVQDYIRQLGEVEQARGEGVMPSQRIKGWLDDMRRQKAEIDKTAKAIEADKLDAAKNGRDLVGPPGLSTWDNAGDLGDISLKEKKPKRDRETFAGAFEFGSADAGKAIAASMGMKNNGNDAVRESVDKGNQIATQQLQANKDILRTLQDKLISAVATVIPVSI